MDREGTAEVPPARRPLSGRSDRGPDAPAVVVDPALTEVRRRRVVAAAIDLGIVLGVLVLLVVLQVERFSRDAGGFFPPSDFDRMATLSAVVHQQLEIGGTRYVLAGAELVMTLVVTVLTALAVYVVVPGSTGTSPGKRVAGLEVVTTSGQVVHVRHTLVRTVVGLVDLLPVVVPGAVGAAIAARSPLGQRLGDRAAGTTVIDARQRLVVTSTSASGHTVPAAEPAGPASLDEVPLTPTPKSPMTGSGSPATEPDGPSTGAGDTGPGATPHRPRVLVSADPDQEPATGVRTERRITSSSRSAPPPRHRARPGSGSGSADVDAHPLRRADDPPPAVPALDPEPGPASSVPTSDEPRPEPSPPRG